MGRAGCEPRALPRASGLEPDEEDWRIFQSLTRVELSGEETRLALTPDQRDAEEKSVFALHFHPEWVPVGLVEKRIKSAFPAAENLLIAPTQHNQLQAMGEFSGVEEDAFAPGAKIKIQLLIHLKSDRLKRAGAFV